MKKSFIAVGFLALLVLFTQQAYAKDGHGRDDDRRHSRHEYYRHHRYFPKEYYYQRKIFVYPTRRYYHYYDVYPQKVCYYNCEKDVKDTITDYVSVTSVANMASQGVPDSAIIYEIERTGSKYRLDVDTINYLRQHGVSEAVIDYMLNAG
ncbi:MAG: hypothetical protein WC695_00425 [Candidatus Omnitrophota bacterium]